MKPSATRRTEAIRPSSTAVSTRPARCHRALERPPRAKGTVWTVTSAHSTASIAQAAMQKHHTTADNSEVSHTLPHPCHCSDNSPLRLSLQWQRPLSLVTAVTAPPPSCHRSWLHTTPPPPCSLTTRLHRCRARSPLGCIFSVPLVAAIPTPRPSCHRSDSVFSLLSLQRQLLLTLVTAVAALSPSCHCSDSSLSLALVIALTTPPHPCHCNGNAPFPWSLQGQLRLPAERRSGR